MVKIKIYYNTGFSILNVPKDLTVLTGASQKIKEFPAMDIVQMYGLENVVVRAKEEDLFNADFMELYKEYETGVQRAFYAIDYNHISFSSMDVANIPITMDPYLTTLYSGFENVFEGNAAGIMGAILKRTNKENPCKTVYDTNQYIQNSAIDDLLIPLGPDTFQYFYAGKTDPITEGFGYIMIKSFVDLKALLEMEDSVFEYKYTETGISVPELPSLNAQYYTTFYINQLLSGGEAMPFRDFSGPWQCIASEYDIPKIVSRLISYGALDSILDSYILPRYAVKGIVKRNDSYSVTSVYAADDITMDFDLFKWLGIDNDDDKYNATKRYMLAAMETKIGLITASGEHDEITLRDLPILDNKLSIRVHVAFDVQRNGGPYYLFGKYKWGNKNPEIEENNAFKILQISRAMEPNACKGMEWQQAVMAGIGINQGAITREKFNTELTYKDYMAQPDIKAATEGGIMNYSQSLFTQAISNITNPNDEVGAYATQSFLGDPSQLNRYLERAKELNDYRLSIKVPSTQVNGTMSYTMRNYFGNGVLIYIKTQAPVIDRVVENYNYVILGRFGYKVYKEANEKDIFEPAEDKDYLYVEADKLEFVLERLRDQIPNVPKSLIENLQNAFSIGFRIWKTRPHS